MNNNAMTEGVFSIPGHVRNGESGFTIMEILVAVMLLAISFTVIMQQFSLGLKNISMSETYIQAVSQARNIMEETLSDTSLKEGRLEGKLGEKYLWVRTISLLSSEKAQTSMPLVEYEIKVAVFWEFAGLRKAVELTTMKVLER